MATPEKRGERESTLKPPLSTVARERGAEATDFFAFFAFGLVEKQESPVTLF